VIGAAPDFTLPDQSGAPWCLSAALQSGPVLLVFYRGDWCPYCNGQLLCYARGFERIEGEGLQLAAISVDSVEQNAALAEKLLLPFPVLSDPDGAVIRTWEVWTDDEGGIARPAVFLVEPDGSVALSYVGNDYADRPGDELIFGRTAAV